MLGTNTFIGNVLRDFWLVNVCRPDRDTNVGQTNVKIRTQRKLVGGREKRFIADARVAKHAVEVLHFGLYVRVDYSIYARAKRVQPKVSCFRLKSAI